MKQTTYQTDLTEPEYELIKPCLHIQRESKWPLQDVISAVFYVCSEGNKWRALPHDFEVPWPTAYWYFRKWEAAGTWKAINEQLVMLRRQRSGADPRPGILVVDSQSTKNSATATEQIGVDGGKKIKGRKDLILTDSQGNLLYTRTLAANKHDGPATWQWWEEVLSTTELLGRVHTIRGDSHFGGVFKKELEAATGIKVELSTDPVDAPSQRAMPVHKGRWVVERTISWGVNSRRLARDYERLPRCREAFRMVSSILRLIKKSNLLQLINSNSF